MYRQPRIRNRTNRIYQIRRPIRIRPSNGKSPKDFFDAARDGDLDKVKECLSKGVGAEAKTDSGLTALHYASDKGHNWR